jgi:hypothetical protein
MKIQTKLGILLLIAGATMGAAPKAPVVVETIKPSATVEGEDGMVFIYREYAQPTAWSPTVKIDGRKVVAIRNRHYTAVRVKPGDHVVSLTWPIIAAQGGAKMEVTVEKGKAHFVEVTGVSQYVPGVYIRTGSGIALVAPDHAVLTIEKCCKFSPPKLK